MDKNENTQVFSLEEILREFGSENPEPQNPEALPEEAESLYAPEESISEEPAVSMPELLPKETELTEDAPAAEAESADTGREESEPQPEAPAQESTVEAEASEAAAPESVQEAPQPKIQTLEGERAPAQPIIFRSRLSELKKKLVAGPEKRYYDLTETGVGRVQAATFLCFLVVLLCAGGTALYAMDMVIPSRLRLMIFSQVLALMVAALLGCYVLMEGVADLFTGKFSLNSMLFLTLAACAADAYFCLQELRVPCCAAFCLEMTFALWDRSLRRSTEMGQMDTLRKAVRLDGLVKSPDYFGSLPGILRSEGRVEDFMDHYNKRTGPEKTLNLFAVLSVLACIGIAALAFTRHGVSLAIQVFSTSMLVAVPASAFVSQSRPAAILQRRLHMVGTVLCGWQGVKTLCGKASFPLHDREIFPLGATKLNGVKFLENFEPEQIMAFAASLMQRNGGCLEPVFTQLLKSRGEHTLPVEDSQFLEGGIRGRILDQDVVLGGQALMDALSIAIPEGTQVAQAVYCAVDGRLAAVFAINYSRTKAAAGGLVTLGGYRKIRPLVLCRDFLVDEKLLKNKFGIRTKRYSLPTPQEREILDQVVPAPELVAGALLTQLNLSASAYAVTGARTLRSTSRIGAGIHLFAGILGLLVMAALAYLGDLQLLSPFNILLYQVVWMVPGLLITEWTRTV